MNQSKLRSWLEIIGNFSVVAGLIFVAFQINQSTILVRAELGSISYDRLVAVDQTFVNENFARVWAMSHENPEDLTLAEMIQLDGYLTSFMDFLESEIFLYGLDIYEGSIELVIPFYSQTITSNRFASAWWSESKSVFSNDLVDLIDTEVANPSTNLDIERFQRIMSRL